jgi:CHAT domain
MNLAISTRYFFLVWSMQAALPRLSAQLVTNGTQSFETRPVRGTEAEKLASANQLRFDRLLADQEVLDRKITSALQTLPNGFHPTLLQEGSIQFAEDIGRQKLTEEELLFEKSQSASTGLRRPKEVKESDLEKEFPRPSMPDWGDSASVTAYYKRLNDWQKMLLEVLQRRGVDFYRRQQQWNNQFIPWLRGKIRDSSLARQRSPEETVGLYLAMLSPRGLSVPIDRRLDLDLAAIQRTRWDDRQKWEALVLICKTPYYSANANGELPIPDACDLALEQGANNPRVLPGEMVALMFHVAECYLSGARRMEEAQRLYENAVSVIINSNLLNGPHISDLYCWVAQQASLTDRSLSIPFLLKAKASLLREKEDVTGIGKQTVGSIDEILDLIAQRQQSLGKWTHRRKEYSRNLTVGGFSGQLAAFRALGPQYVGGKFKASDDGIIYDALSLNIEWMVEQFKTVGHFKSGGGGADNFSEGLDLLYDEVPAVTSFIRADCKTDACRQSAYGFLTRLKGLLVSTLNTRTITPPVATALDVKGYLDLLQKPGEDRVDPPKSVAVLKEPVEVANKNLERPSPVRGSSQPSQANRVDFSGRLERGEAFLDLYQYSAENNSRRANAYLGVITLWRAKQQTPDPPIFIDLANSGEVALSATEWFNLTVNREPKAALILAKILATVASQVRVQLPSDIVRLIVAPDGDLSALPWHMLGSYIGRPVYTVLSIQHLAAIRSGPPVGRPSKDDSLLVVRNVDYGTGTQFLPITSDDGMLPIVRGFGGKITELSGTGASKADLSRALSVASFAHIQTHGEFELDATVDSSLEKSYLALSGANSLSPETRLTARELSRLDLRHMWLLTLAACKSAGGNSINGQGTSGLSAAVAATGVSSGLISLWNVPEAEGAELMRGFYQNLWQGNMSPTDALIEAQLTVRKNSPDPYYWAGWIILGIN